ncbi:MAG TPA: hypothetical protein VI776_09945 [Anaerolineales bacterium]|nr:hypothetical protein [Anaerolineales bacterium]
MLKSSDLSSNSYPINPWLAAARIGWIILLVLTIALFVQGINTRFGDLVQNADTRSLLDLGVTSRTLAIYVVSINVILISAHAIIAMIIFWRRPGDWLALLVAYALVSNGAIIPLSRMYATGENILTANLLFMIIAIVALISSINLLYLFPDGKFVPKWTILPSILWGFLAIFAVIFPHSPLSLTSWAIPLQLLMLLIVSLTGVYAQVYRYKEVSSPIQRQQTKWAILGLFAAVLGPLAFFVPFVIVPSLRVPEASNLLYQNLGPSFFTFSFLSQMVGLTISTLFGLLFPVSFAIAVLRYRLWDIDILINRALVYGALTGLLVIIYLVSVVILQGVFLTFTGRGQSQMVTVLSTLGIAALFIPLQRRIQSVIDRRFYRSRYDAAKTLAAFSNKLREEVDLNQLCDQLKSVVRETMQPSRISILLKAPDGRYQKIEK